MGLLIWRLWYEEWRHSKWFDVIRPLIILFEPVSSSEKQEAQVCGICWVWNEISSLTEFWAKVRK
jgi:hypothetical protein